LFPQAVTIPLLDDHYILTQVASHQVDVIRLLPPLLLSEEDIDWFISGFEAVMERLEHFPGPLGTVLGKLGKMSFTSRG